MKGYEDISEYVSYITKNKIKEEYYFYYMMPDEETISFMNTENFSRIIFKVEDYKLWIRNRKINKIIKK